jgi:hypothetical protein
MKLAGHFPPLGSPRVAREWSQRRMGMRTSHFPPLGSPRVAREWSQRRMGR